MEHVSIRSGPGDGALNLAVKLGRLRPSPLPTTLKFKKYFDSSEMRSTPPLKVDYAAKALDAIRRMYANDRLGDCVIAGKAHQVGLWSGNDDTAGEQSAILATDDEVIAEYHGICGPGDNGCNITSVLDVMKSRGLKFGGAFHKIDGYVSVDNTNKLEIQVAIYLFGSLTLGVNLPSAWTCTDCTWDVTNSRLVGGHDVCTVGYDEIGVQVATWGGIATITWAAFLSRKWVEECYAQLAPSWYGKDNLAPNGVDVAKLKSDLAAIGGGVIPDPGPGPGPFPPAPPPPPSPPSPPPAPPRPQTFSVAIPSQRVAGGFWSGYYVPAQTVIGQINASEAAPRVPPWLVELLKLACSGAVVLPPPWNVVASILCGVRPRGDVSGADLDTFTLPPWFLPLLRSLCRQNLDLPQPWDTLAQFACALLPAPEAAKSPCGCK